MSEKIYILQSLLYVTKFTKEIEYLLNEIQFTVNIFLFSITKLKCHNEMNKLRLHLSHFYFIPCENSEHFL